MCNFHSVVGVAVGQNITILHDPSNSHSEIADRYQKGLVNKPHRRSVLFEAEWDGEGEIPKDTVLIRNFGDCPDRLVKKIREHYIKVKEAISEGKHLNTYFSDIKKWSDVWNQAISNGTAVQLPSIFEGSLSVPGSAKLDAPALTKVGGSLSVSGSAKLDALTEVGGYLDVRPCGQLIAPKLKK